MEGGSYSKKGDGAADKVGLSAREAEEIHFNAKSAKVNAKSAKKYRNADCYDLL